MNSPQADRLQAALWIAAGLALLLLLQSLSPILTPFLLGGIVAYICNPLVDRLTSIGVPRVLAVLAILLMLTLVLIGLLLILVPLVNYEASQLVLKLPEGVRLANEKLLPWLERQFGIQFRIDAESLQMLAAGNWDTVQNLLLRLYNSLRIGGVALIGLIVNVMLAPVVTFYLLLDWHALLARLGSVIPRPWHPKVAAMTHDVDAVLSEFLRGQLLVMFALAGYYVVALWLVGLPSALPVGLITGLLIFVPYLGYATGLMLAISVALLQFGGWQPILGVAAVYGIGQLLESFLLTPYLVGERIGLAPLAVIFSLMAFGQLFGFFGVLLALPASAALLVGLREIRLLYVTSRFYRGSE